MSAVGCGRVGADPHIVARRQVGNIATFLKVGGPMPISAMHAPAA